MGPVSRRGFLTGTTAALTLAACGVRSPPARQSAPRLAGGTGGLCDRRPASGPIRIDMHAHILNLRDLSAGPFIARRVLNYDESNVPGLDAAVGFIVSIFADILKGTTKPTPDEHGNLRYELARTDIPQPAFRDPGKFCRFAERYQDGLFKAARRNQLTGVFSNKVRNAAPLAEVYPSIDIFMPSVVDLYDDRRSMRAITQQIAFYELLNLSTAGRYLPMISFNPQRHYTLKTQHKVPDATNYLARVKDAIRARGFVGVKLHASSGFSPLRNLTYGCSNTATQIVTENDQQLYDRFTAYDALMDDLFRFCAAMDVPVLTHGSTGLTSNRRCMRGPRLANGTQRPAGPRKVADDEWGYLYRGWGRRGGKDSDAPLEWTNSPTIWNEVSRTYGLKVCISHFANAFRKKRIGRRTARISPSAWLVAAAEAARTNPNLYVDLSIITEFFTRDEDGRITLQDAYVELFERFNRQYPKLRKQLVYGTDWHMPDTARVGAAYLPLIEQLLDRGGLAAEIPAIMGERAADIFGLRRGRQTRARLDEFYARAGQDYAGRPFTSADIDWMGRLG